MSENLSQEWRRDLAIRFDSEWSRAFPDHVDRDHIADERAAFLDALDGLADALSTLRERPLEKERKRKLESAAKALGKLVEALEEVDRDAIAYVLSEAVKEAGGEAGRMAPIGYFAAGQVLVDQIKPAVSTLHIAAARAAKSLPVNDVNVRAEIARGVEREITLRGFAFTVSPEGFAAACLSAVFEAAGLECKNPRHWLEQARA